jgi:hypothetical protein
VHAARQRRSRLYLFESQSSLERRSEDGASHRLDRHMSGQIVGRDTTSSAVWKLSGCETATA